jgi:hypothetical protein
MRLDFINIVSFEVLNIVFGSFVPNMPEGTNKKTNFCKKLYFIILQPEVTAGSQRWKLGRNEA